MTEYEYKYYDGGKLAITLKGEVTIVEPDSIITISTDDPSYEYVDSNPRFEKLSGESKPDSKPELFLADKIKAAKSIKELRELADANGLESKDTSFKELKEELLKELEEDEQDD